jgi:hypothetical protein
MVKRGGLFVLGGICGFAHDARYHKTVFRVQSECNAVDCPNMIRRKNGLEWVGEGDVVVSSEASGTWFSGSKNAGRGFSCRPSEREKAEQESNTPTGLLVAIYSRRLLSKLR